MGETTAISWTDHTFNPWWGCARVSPGCQNCYAEAFAKRTGNAEPLLGYVELGEELTEGVSWIIVGGESGPNHRPLDRDDARALRDEAESFGIPFLFKQHGGHRPSSGGDLLDGRQHKAFPARAQR